MRLMLKSLSDCAFREYWANGTLFFKSHLSLMDSAVPKKGTRHALWNASLGLAGSRLSQPQQSKKISLSRQKPHKSLFPFPPVVSHDDRIDIKKIIRLDCYLAYLKW
jgi:hypothetical protein